MILFGEILSKLSVLKQNFGTLQVYAKVCQLDIIATYRTFQGLNRHHSSLLYLPRHCYKLVIFPDCAIAPGQ